jgi:hypothetical protein
MEGRGRGGEKKEGGKDRGQKDAQENVKQAEKR